MPNNKATLREINLFKLTPILTNYSSKLSKICEYGGLEYLCLVHENNEIFFRRSDKQGIVSIKVLCWFNDTNRCIQDIDFHPEVDNLLILCYDNTLHTVSLEKVFEKNLKQDAQVITSYIVPFIGPHECPNAKTCPNNFDVGSSGSNHSSMVSGSQLEDHSPVDNDMYSMKKIDEFMKTNKLYSAMYGEIGTKVSASGLNVDGAPSTEGSDVEVLSDGNQECYDQKNILSKDSTFDDSKTYSTSLGSTSYPCPYPTCCIWWLTLHGENRAILGYSDGTICFVGITPDCPFIGSTSLTKGAIERMDICRESSSDLLSLMTTTTIGEQWKLLLEHKSISYIYPGEYSSTTSKTSTIDNDLLEEKQSGNEIDGDWQIVMSLNENNGTMAPGPSGRFIPQIHIDQPDNKPIAKGLFSSAKARFNLIKGLMSIAKTKLSESCSKNVGAEKGFDPSFRKIESTTLAVMDAPGQYPVKFPTSGPFFTLQNINGEQFLGALHGYSDTMSVHSLDLSLIPLFIYKLPVSSKNVLLTSNLIYSIQGQMTDLLNAAMDGTTDLNVPQKSVDIEDVNNLNDIKNDVTPTATPTEPTSSEISGYPIEYLNVLSCQMASAPISIECEFNEKSLLARFEFENQRIISIHRRSRRLNQDTVTNEQRDAIEEMKNKSNHFFDRLQMHQWGREILDTYFNNIDCMITEFPRTEYDQCYVVTDKNVYSVELTDLPHIIFMNLVNTSSWSLCEDFCSTFNLSLPHCIQYAGDVLLRQKQITQALLTFNVARIPPAHTAMKLAFFCEWDALKYLSAMALNMSYILKSKYPVHYHIEELLETAHYRIELYTKKPIFTPKKRISNVSGMECSDFNYERDETSNDLKISNESLSHLSNYLFLTLCERATRDPKLLPLWNFLVLNKRYDVTHACAVLCECGLISSAILLAKVRGVAMLVFNYLLKTISISIDDYLDINAIFFNLSDEMFMECITYMHKMAHIYFDLIKQNSDRFNSVVLERLRVQLNPFHEVYRPIIMKVKCLDGMDEFEKNSELQEIIDWYESFIETYIIVLIKLKTLKNPATVFVNGLTTFNMKYEDELTAYPNTDLSDRFSAGFTHGLCIVNRVAYMWGSIGLYPMFDLKEMEYLESSRRLAYSRIEEMRCLRDLNIDVLAVKCGAQHFMMKTTNGLYCVGGNAMGQLGIGRHISQVPHPVLVRAFEGKNIEIISIGQYHNAVVAEGDLYTWGWGLFGQLGHGDIENVYTPKLVEFFRGRKITQVALGYSHTLVLCDGGDLFVFGSNHFGQLGIGRYVPSYCFVEGNDDFGPEELRKPLKMATRPIQFDLDDGDRIRLIHTRYFTSFIVTELNKLYTWGQSRHSLRLASQRRRSAKQQFTPNEDATMKTDDIDETFSEQSKVENEKLEVKEFSKVEEDTKSKEGPIINDNKDCSDESSNMNEDGSNVEYVEAKSEDGTNGAEEEKDGGTESAAEESCEHYYPKEVDISEVDGNIIELSSGLYHFALMTSNMSLYTWGKNLECQLGHEGPRADVKNPKRLDVIDNPLHVQCGIDFTLVMTADHEIKAFGNNSAFQCAREIPTKDASSRLIRLKSSKRLVRIPDINQFVKTPVTIPLPRQAENISAIAFLKDIPKFKPECVVRCFLSDQLHEMPSRNGTIDSNFGEICNDSLESDERDNLEEYFEKNLIIGTTSQLQPPIITSPINSEYLSTDVSNKLEHNENQYQQDINDLIHYCLFIFNGLYKPRHIIDKLNSDQVEYKIKMLMMDYKFIEAFKCAIEEKPTPKKSLKIFKYFTRDGNVYPMHTEDLKFFIYEIFLHFINNGFPILELEEFFLRELDFYFIQLAYVLYFNNNNSELERSVLNKYKTIFDEVTGTIGVETTELPQRIGHFNQSLIENCDLIFKSVSTKFSVTICQKIIEFGKEIE